MTLFSAFVVAGFATLAVADTVYFQSQEYHVGAYGPGPTQTFYSSPLTPVAFNLDVPVNSSSNVDPGYIFIAPRGDAVVKPQVSIFTNNGSLVWAGPEYGQSMTFQVVNYKNEDHILLWSGDFQLGGYGNGRNLILDRTYAVVANFTLEHGMEGSNLAEGVGADFHDAQITANDTALMTAYNPLARDLTSFGGPADGWLYEGIAQELDVETNTVLFEWHSLDHVDPSLCFANPVDATEENPWDYFHINSIEKDSKGNFLIDSRHCHAAYYVSGETGEILWTLGGRNSSFAQGEGTAFYYQHDARWHANETQISIFDNAASTWEVNEDTARGIILDIDLNAMTANLAREYLPWNRTASPSQGNVQVNETSGNAMVGYGYVPQLAEYNQQGEILYAASFGVAGGPVQTYRAHRSPWVGYPATNPSIAVFPNSTNSIFVSWNGATEVHTWSLYGANESSSSEPTLLSNTTRTGFETALSIPGSPPVSYVFYQVAGLDSQNTILGFSNLTSADPNVASEPPSDAQKSQIGAHVPNSPSASNASTDVSPAGTAGTATPSSTGVTAAGQSGAGRSIVRAGAGAMVVGMLSICLLA